MNRKLMIPAVMFFCFISIPALAETEAPDFELDEITGITRKLSDYRGRVVLINFTATWCPYCRNEIPDLKKLHRKFSGDDFEFLVVYVGETSRKVSAFAKKYELPYTILLDTSTKVARSYGVRGVPTKVLVDRNGNVVCVNCPELEETIRKEIDKTPGGLL